MIDIATLPLVTMLVSLIFVTETKTTVRCGKITKPLQVMTFNPFTLRTPMALIYIIRTGLKIMIVATLPDMLSLAS